MLKRRQRRAAERLRGHPVILIDQPELKRDASADRVVKDQPKDRGQHQRNDDRHQQRRAITKPLAQVLAENDQHRAHHRSITKSLAGQMQEHCLEVRLLHLD